MTIMHVFHSSVTRALIMAVGILSVLSCEKKVQEQKKDPEPGPELEIESGTGEFQRNDGLADSFPGDILPSDPKPDDPQPAETAKVMKIMSFNVRYENSGDTGVKSWSNRSRGVYAMLEQEQPLIMGVQECLVQQRNAIIENCPQYSAIGVGRDDGKEKGEMMVVFYLSSELIVEEWGTYWLSETPETVSISWGAGCYRTATWAKFRFNEGGREFYYTNTHLDHVSDAVREKQMAVLEKMMAKYNKENLPMVLTADFNMDQDNSIFNGINGYMFNARKSSPVTDNSTTYNDFGNRTDSVIDDIFYSKDGFKSQEFKTVTQAFSGVTYISDHYPIYAELSFN